MIRIKILLLFVTICALCTITFSYGNIPYGWYQRKRGYWHQEETGNYKCVPMGTCPGNNVSLIYLNKI